MNKQSKKNQYRKGGKPQKSIPYVAEFHITEDKPVTIPREEYDALVDAESTLNIIELLLANDDPHFYLDPNVLRAILGLKLQHYANLDVSFGAKEEKEGTDE